MKRGVYDKSIVNLRQNIRFLDHAMSFERKYFLRKTWLDL